MVVMEVRGTAWVGGWLGTEVAGTADGQGGWNEDIQRRVSWRPTQNKRRAYPPDADLTAN